MSSYNDNSIPVLFESCRLVRGVKRSLFIDIQRRSYRYFPNELVSFIAKGIGRKVKEIKKEFANKFDDIIDHNLRILEEEEFIFFTDHPEWFPKMSLHWEEPATITNALLDINSLDNRDFLNLWNQFSKLGCEHIQVRAYDLISLHKIEAKLNLIGSLRIISLELVIPYDSDLSEKDYLDFVYRQPRVFTLILTSANVNKEVFISPTGMGHVFFIMDKIDVSSHCGQIGHEFFSINLKTFTESQLFNSCLNRKISIDAEGNIKNCPSMRESYGNIKDTTLAEAIEKPGFKKYWNINKDMIHVCKDCEFRYICTDCRAYVEDPEDILSKPLKCGYNPYTGEWSEWSTNPLKQKAIDFYGMREMVDEMGDGNSSTETT